VHMNSRILPEKQKFVKIRREMAIDVVAEIVDWLYSICG